MSTEFETSSGEQRNVEEATSLKVYFFYYSPTGTKMFLNKSPIAKSVWTRGSFHPDIMGNREIINGYELIKSGVIEMVVLRSRHGRNRESNTIKLSLSPGAPLIRVSVKGGKGFGYFSGRAVIQGDTNNNNVITVEILDKGGATGQSREKTKAKQGVIRKKF